LKLASRFAIPQLPLVVAYTEGFFYPHGVAFGVTVELTQRKPIEEVVNALIDLQQNRRLVPPATTAAGALKLSGYAVQCLGALRARGFATCSAGSRLLAGMDRKWKRARSGVDWRSDGGPHQKP